MEHVHPQLLSVLVFYQHCSSALKTHFKVKKTKPFQNDAVCLHGPHAVEQKCKHPTLCWLQSHNRAVITDLYFRLCHQMTLWAQIGILLPLFAVSFFNHSVGIHHVSTGRSSCFLVIFINKIMLLVKVQ